MTPRTNIPMLQFDLNLLIAPLMAFSAAAILLVFAMPALEARARRKRRVELALGGRAGSKPANSGGKPSTRRKAVEKTLREIEERQNALKGSRRRPTLDRRLREAGLTWQPLFYWLINLLVAACTFAILSGFGPLVSVSVGLATGLVLPYLHVGLLRRRRLAAFAAKFPDAIDVIVRGVRAGRPLADCLAIIAADSEEPIRSEFRQVVEDQSVGLPVTEAVERLAQRVPLQEVNFLSVLVSIQSRAGGSLTEALGNLSTVLRGRRQLHAKVKAMSAEAKTSAGIIGALPVVVAVLVHLTSPEYLALLYQTDTGIFVMSASLFWMAIGTFVMRQMINFDM